MFNVINACRVKRIDSFCPLGVKRVAKRGRPRKNAAQVPGANSETQIVNAYIRLCHEIGADNVTLQKIADRAGVAFGTVRYYFSSGEKAIYDEAFKLVLMNSYRSIEDLLIEHRKKGSFNPVHMYVETMFQWAKSFPHEGSYLIYMYYLSAAKVPLQILAGETVERARLRVEGLLHEAIGMGIYKPVKDAAECAAKIHSLVVGFGFIALSFRDPKKFEVQKRLCTKAIDEVIQASSK